MLTNFLLTLGLGLAVFGSQVAFADSLTQAKRIHDRLTGTPPSAAVLQQMADAIDADPVNGDKAAAAIALQDPAFYNVTLKNFVAPWTNEEQTVFTPLNDYTATVIGMIRDDIDFREVLSGDIIYTGNVSPAYSTSNNAHYEALEALGSEQGNLADDTILKQQSQSAVTGLDASATAGVLTTRAAARAFFIDGTNRAMFRFTFINYLCTDLEPLKDNSRIPDHVHQDVSRSPGGDSRIYLNSCVGCHAGMDGMMGAFAHYNLAYDKDGNGNVIEDTAKLEYTPNEIQAKFLQNANNFKPGNVTTDDSWVNYWRKGQNALLGWANPPPAGVTLDSQGYAVGFGAKALGRELANSDAFAQCQVKKAFETVCLREPGNSADRSEVETIVSDFKDGYKMKQVFRDVAAYCKGD